MKISEIFLSCQGEGQNVGFPSLFVRFAGCNLRSNSCRWCDTPYAQALDSGEEMTVDEVLLRLVELGRLQQLKRFVITGGEPLFQELSLLALVQSLIIEPKARVEIFTNGTLQPPAWLELAQWCVDIKCPSSGVKESKFTEWFNALQQTDSVKFVVADENDLAYTREVTAFMPRRGPQVLVSSMIPNEYDGDLTKGRIWRQRVWEFCVQNNFRHSLQTHKPTFGNRKGV